MSSTPGKSSSRSNPLILQQTLRFLNTASFELSTLSPLISAHLSREVSDITYELPFAARPKAGAEQKFQVCRSCGSVAVPGVTITGININRGANPLVKHGKRQISKGTQKSVRTKCLICGHIIKEMIVGNARKLGKQQDLEGHETKPDKEITLPPELIEVEPIGRPLTRRQRQIRAKKESSLQAMLRKSKEREKQAQSGFGLGIIDLMKMDET